MVAMEEFDRITVIEKKLADAMLLINQQSITPSGYEFYNTVTIVNIDDEAVATSYGDYPLISVYLEDGEEVMSGQANAYENNLAFVLRCNVSNDSPIGIARFDINRKMNSILSDLKAVISLDSTLDGTCDIVSIIRSRRSYANDGNTMSAGVIEIYLDVIYSQSRTRPDLNVC